MALGRRVRRAIDEHRATDPDAVRTAALAMLGRREYASGELTSALIRKGYAAAVAAEVVAQMAEERLVDDTRYASSLVRVLAGRGQGPARIRQELREAGIPDEQVTAALDGGPDWSELAAEVRQRKFGTAAPPDWPERARQMRFLQYRGFSKDHLGRALGSSSGVDDDDS
jgi:regulatory protein